MRCSITGTMRNFFVIQKMLFSVAVPASLLVSCSSFFSNSSNHPLLLDIPDHNQISNSAELNNNGFHSYYKETNTFFDKPARPFECENQNGPAEPVRIRKRGRPRTKEVQQVKSGNEIELFICTVGSHPQIAERRNVKLYQFLMNLLMDRKTNPSLIKWENYEEGKFKFVQNEKVAKLWGDRKLNGKMNYEKFSRAMR